MSEKHSRTDTTLILRQPNDKFDVTSFLAGPSRLNVPYFCDLEFGTLPSNLAI